VAADRPTIGLALSGGAARGIAHVGVLRALSDNNIPVDYIAGTSAGSLVGGAFASGMPLDQIVELGRQMRWRDVGRMTMSRLGVQSNERLEQYLRERLPIARFQDLPIPFAAVATDLKTGSAVILRDKGDVPFAIRASCAIPGWYVPVIDEEGRQRTCRRDSCVDCAFAGRGHRDFGRRECRRREVFRFDEFGYRRDVAIHAGGPENGLTLSTFALRSRD
jgi:predicted acylesterase/phospholipase RssA